MWLRSEHEHEHLPASLLRRAQQIAKFTPHLDHTLLQPAVCEEKEGACWEAAYLLELDDMGMQQLTVVDDLCLHILVNMLASSNELDSYVRAFVQLVFG